jgi:hypothetical protein
MNVPFHTHPCWKSIGDSRGELVFHKQYSTFAPNDWGTRKWCTMSLVRQEVFCKNISWRNSLWQTSFADDRPYDWEHLPIRVMNGIIFVIRVDSFSEFAGQIAHLEGSEAMLRMSQELWASHLDELATDDELCFRYFYPFSRTYPWSPLDVIPTILQQGACRKWSWW